MIPPAVNGHPHEKSVPSADPSDTKILYAIVGGIICAFLIGIVLLVVAMMSDWT